MLDVGTKVHKVGRRLAKQCHVFMHQSFHVSGREHYAQITVHANAGRRVVDGGQRNAAPLPTAASGAWAVAAHFVPSLYQFYVLNISLKIIKLFQNSKSLIFLLRSTIII